MESQDFGAEQADNRRRGIEEPAVNQTFEIDYPDVFALEIHRSDRQSRDGRHLHATLFQIHPGRTVGRFAQRNLHPADEPRMKQRRERAGVHHEPRWSAIHGAVHVKIEAVADVDRDPAEPGEIKAGDRARHARIDFQNENLSLAIEERFGREQNIGAENAVDLVAFGGTAKAAEIDEDHRFIDEIERAEAQILGDGDGIERAVDAEPRWDVGLAGDGRESEMLATSVTTIVSILAV